ncbi:MAG: flagellar basal-body rod protein FlgG [Actinomycetota bacterium]|nr:flagellar basal-body rod protein FlgG [Actinomycetota bacterium]
MIRSLNISTMGLQVQQFNMDAIANNLANINTTAYKRQAVGFKDLLYTKTDLFGTPLLPGAAVTSQSQIGKGVAISQIRQIFDQGPLAETGQELDLAIDGDGFFQVKLADGTFAHTRDGTFSIDGASGNLITPGGNMLDPAIILPQGTVSFKVSEDGKVTATVVKTAEGSGEPMGATEEEVGQINLFKFPNPEGLLRLGNNLYAATEVSGAVTTGAPGAAGFGLAKQGFLEGSNVNLTDEMVNMMLALKAYQVNSKAIMNSDNMLSIANQIPK